MPDALPDGAVDTHVHVFDPARAFPPDAGYVPNAQELKTIDDLAATLDAAGVSRAVLVQPSGYGADNSLIIDLIRGAPHRWAGVAVVSGASSAAEIERLRAAGVRGIRINLRQSAGLFGAGDLERLAEIAGSAGLIVHLQADASLLPAVLPRLSGAGTIMLDHLGFPDPTQTAPELIARLATDDRLFMKLSGAFRLSRQPAPHEDIDRYAAAVLDSFGPHRCVWGSDWPFINTDSVPAYADTLASLMRWVPDPAARRIILCDTPQRLYFDEVRA